MKDQENMWRSSLFAGTARSYLDLHARFRAGVVHFLFSGAIAASVLTFVYGGWYPAPLDSISGVGDVLLLLLGVDIVLGPLLTVIVYDRRKCSLTVDLSCIVILQISALVYGVCVLESGRPHYLVFVKDRFEVVSHADLRPEDREAGVGNPHAAVSWIAPTTISAEMPASAEENERLMLEAMFGGRDVQHFPKQYRDYEGVSLLAAAKALPLTELRALNPDRDRFLHSAIEATGLPESDLKFLPIKGPKRDGAMLINGLTGKTVGMVALQPWR